MLWGICVCCVMCMLWSTLWCAGRPLQRRSTLHDHTLLGEDCHNQFSSATCSDACICVGVGGGAPRGSAAGAARADVDSRAVAPRQLPVHRAARPRPRLRLLPRHGPHAALFPAVPQGHGGPGAPRRAPHRPPFRHPCLRTTLDRAAALAGSGRVGRSHRAHPRHLNGCTDPMQARRTAHRPWWPPTCHELPTVQYAAIYRC